MRGLPAQGICTTPKIRFPGYAFLLTRLPITISVSDSGFFWTFVPFTAAGQQGFLTPFRFFIP